MITEASPRSLGSTPTVTIFVGAGAGGGKGGGTGGNSDVATGGLSLGAMSSKFTGKPARRLSSLRGVTSLRGELDELPALSIMPLLRGDSSFTVRGATASASCQCVIPPKVPYAASGS